MRHLQESFIVDWDELGVPPNDDLGPTAGNYGTWTNIYQIGKVVGCLPGPGRLPFIPVFHLAA